MIPGLSFRITEQDALTEAFRQNSPAEVYLSEKLLELIPGQANLARLGTPRSLCGAQERVLKQLLHIIQITSTLAACRFYVSTPANYADHVNTGCMPFLCVNGARKCPVSNAMACRVGVALHTAGMCNMYPLQPGTVYMPSNSANHHNIAKHHRHGFGSSSLPASVYESLDSCPGSA